MRPSPIVRGEQLVTPARQVHSLAILFRVAEHASEMADRIVHDGDLGHGVDVVIHLKPDIDDPAFPALFAMRTTT